MLLYALTMLVGATLLFLVQPMFARMALPLLGGSPAVWNVAMLFYQASLLAGYAYAHVATRWLGARRQPLLHVAVLLLPLLMLPIGVPDGWRPPAESSPVWWFMGLLAATVGLPFFVVSTTSPLLQAWFARTGHPQAANPYPLYAASNAGSMLALLAYPTLVEPALSLSDQSRLWAAGYVLLALLVAACAAVVWRGAAGRRPVGVERAPAGDGRATDHAPPDGQRGSLVGGAALSLRRRARWVLLAFVPSSLMLSVTAYLSTNIAPIPLLWTLPLALYLLTFVLVFGAEVFPHTGMVRALPVVALPLVVVMAAQATAPLELLLPLHLAVFFVAAMVCHGELARDRPPAAHLTEFYLWLSVGGALGGVLNAIVAPLLFSNVAEYPLVLALACMLLPRARPDDRDAGARRSALLAWDLALPAALGLLTAGLVLGSQQARLAGPAALGLSFGLPVALSYMLVRRPLRFGLAVGAVLLASGLYVGDQGRVLYTERSFFGVSRVLQDASGRFHLLAHGATLHGVQSRDPARSREPLSYYERSGPAGQVFAVLGPSRRSVAAVGLGVGSLACYREPGQAWTFYEIDPAVERIARDERLFTFMRDCGAGVPVVLGDARLTLDAAPDGGYDLMVMDAYTSDSVPVHLITREALALYLRKLGPGGVLAFHTSNQFFDLRVVLGGLARDAGLVALVRDDTGVTQEEQERGKSGSQWVVLARQRGDLGPLAQDARWQALDAPPGTPVWTDDYSSVLTALKVLR